MPAKKYIEYFTGTTPIELWKFSGMSEEKKVLKIELN